MGDPTGDFPWPAWCLPQCTGVFQPNSRSMRDWLLTTKNRNMAPPMPTAHQDKTLAEGQVTPWEPKFQWDKTRNDFAGDTSEFCRNWGKYRFRTLGIADVKPSNCSHNAVHHLPPTSCGEATLTVLNPYGRGSITKTTPTQRRSRPSWHFRVCVVE